MVKFDSVLAPLVPFTRVMGGRRRKVEGLSGGEIDQFFVGSCKNAALPLAPVIYATICGKEKAVLIEQLTNTKNSITLGPRFGWYLMNLLHCSVNNNLSVSCEQVPVIIVGKEELLFSVWLPNTQVSLIPHTP